jgi:hypothetical protein
MTALGVQTKQRRPVAAALVTLCDIESLFAVILGVSLHGLFFVIAGVGGVPPSRVSMVGGLLMTPGLMMLGRFAVVTSSMCVMFCCLLVVLCSLLGHWTSSVRVM